MPEDEQNLRGKLDAAKEQKTLKRWGQRTNEIIILCMSETDGRAALDSASQLFKRNGIKGRSYPLTTTIMDEKRL